MIIYILTNSVTGERYVGRTRNSLKFRFQQHCYEADLEHPQLIYRALAEYGKENFIPSILEEGIKTFHLLKERENHWIKELKPEYNMTHDKNGEWIGRPQTKESRDKIAKKATGRPKTPEECAAISKRLIGNDYGTNIAGSPMSGIMPYKCRSWPLIGSVFVLGRLRLTHRLLEATGQGCFSLLRTCCTGHVSRLGPISRIDHCDLAGASTRRSCGIL